jgi:hypothetical protein
MRSVADIIEEVKNKQRLHDYKVDQLHTIVRTKDLLNESLNATTATKDEVDNLIYTCKLILEKLTYGSKAKLENFLTYALKNIFVDRDYSIELVLKEDTKKPGLELTLLEAGISQEITDAVGGGIISTLGLLLQIYYIEIYNLNRIMFIDEGLKEVSTGSEDDIMKSTNYLENLLIFLGWLANEKKYKFIIVTHDQNVRKFANCVYEVKNGDVVLC